MWELEIIQDPPLHWWQGWQPTMATDGTYLMFDSRFVLDCSFDETKGLNVHEVQHNAYGDSWRRGNRDPGNWNMACDYRNDPLLIESGYVLPKGGHVYQPWYGKSAEWIYEQLQKEHEKEKEPNGPGPGQGDDQQQQRGRPNNGGLVLDDRTADSQNKQVEWQMKVIQAAAMAKAEGKLPAGIEQLVESIVHPKTNWRSALWNWFNRVSRNDYDWSMPNYKYIPMGLYLPRLHSNVLGTIVIVSDTSGSIEDETLAEFGANITAVIEETKPEKVILVEADAAVQRVREIEPGDEVKFETWKGRGGTRFEPAFEYIEKNDIQPDGLIYLTDLEGSFPKEAPMYPVLWARTENHPVPFGECIDLWD